MREKSGVVYGRRRSAAATASLPLWLQISTFSSPLAMFNWRDEELLKAFFTQGNFFIKYGTYPGETSTVRANGVNIISDIEMVFFAQIAKF